MKEWTYRKLKGVTYVDDEQLEKRREPSAESQDEPAAEKVEPNANARSNASRQAVQTTRPKRRPERTVPARSGQRTTPENL